MRVARVAVVGDEQVLRVGQRLAVEPAAHQRRRRRPLLARLRVGQVEEIVLGELRMRQDLEQSTLTGRPDFRHSGNRLRDRACPCGRCAGGPGVSVTSMSPLGRKAMLHGFSRPLTTGTARSLTPTVSTSRGASGNGSVGTRGNPPGAFEAPGGPPRPTGGCSGRAGAGCCAVAGAWSERAIARVMAVAVEAVAVCVCLCIDLSPEPMNLARRFACQPGLKTRPPHW